MVESGNFPLFIQFRRAYTIFFRLRVYPFIIKIFLRGIACLGTSDDQEWNSGQASF